MLSSKIKEGDNSETEIKGYKRNNLKSILTYFLYICTCFLLRLVFHWVPRWYIIFTHTPCSLRDAGVILAKDQYHRYWIHHVKLILKSGESKHSNVKNKKTRLLIDYQPEQVIRYFVHKKIKYIWNWKLMIFENLRGLEQVNCSEFYKAMPLTEIEVKSRTALYGENAIEVQITPLIVLLLKEGLNPFYIFQICSCTLWFLDDYTIYASCIIIMSAISLSIQLYDIRKNEKTLRNTVVSIGNAWVCRDGKTFHQINANELVPGDIVEIPRSGCTMFCDAAVIAGNCIVNESMLTGESVPVTKTPLPNPTGLVPFSPNSAQSVSENIPVENNDLTEIFDVKHHSRHILYCGTKVIQSRNFENEPVLAVVIRTGYLTAKGELVRSILFPKPIDIKFNRDAFKFIGMLALFALSGFIYTIIVMIHRQIDVGKIIIRSLDIITIIIPPALPVAMTIGIVFAQSRLKKKSIYCISPNTINTCGGINVSCFDKTGTLTEDGLDLWGVVESRKDGSFNEAVSNPETLPFSPLIESMATCHSLNIIEGELCGDPLDLKMFQSVKWEIKEGVDGTENEFQMSVPMIAYKNNKNQEKEYQIGILRQFPFSSSLQRMSVITKLSSRANFNVYVKGSPEVVSSLCRKETVPRDFSSKLLEFTHAGYRVLALAYRPLKISYAKMMRIPRQEVECELRFLGFLVMENRLKPETEAIIDELKAALIRPIMVTGDNMLTALSVARDCGIIAELDKIILVDARMTSGDLCNPIIEFHYAEDLQRPVNEISVMNKNRSQSNKGGHVKICIMERPDFHLAMSGKTWGLIRDKCPELIPKLVVKGAVFARFAPEQKTQLIESLQSIGYFVSMCGDGANDCGALKAAHSGISLSETEASVASPFTSKIQNISCVPELIKEGRCALTTSFGTFKFMAGYSFTQFISVLILYWITANLGDYQFLYIDLFVITTLGVTYGYTKACNSLSVETPGVRLLTVSVMASLIFQWTINAMFQITAYFYVTYQPWYFLPPPSKDKIIHSAHANTVVFTISVFQYLILAFVFSKGAPFRAPIYKNYIFVINLLIVLAVSVYIVFKPFVWLQNLLNLVPFPSLWVNGILFSFVIANFLISYFIEYVIDNMSLRRQMKRIKLLLFPQFVDKAEYERIREEINNCAATWPPLIKCASVQEMRPEIFTDSSALHVSQSAQDLVNLKDSERDIEILKEEAESDELQSISDTEMKLKRSITSTNC